jgi:hypothetical protein
LGIGPLAALVDVTLFTSLFGAICAGLLIGSDNIGAAEPCEYISEGESGPKLDLGLSLWELFGIVDSRFIHDPLDETDSLRPSSSVPSRADEESPYLSIENLFPVVVCEDSILEVCGRDWGIGGGVEELAYGEDILSMVITVELVPGRDIGEDMF